MQDRARGRVGNWHYCPLPKRAIVQQVFHVLIVLILKKKKYGNRTWRNASFKRFAPAYRNLPPPCQMPLSRNLPPPPPTSLCPEELAPLGISIGRLRGQQLPPPAKKREREEKREREGRRREKEGRKRKETSKQKGS